MTEWISQIVQAELVSAKTSETLPVYVYGDRMIRRYADVEPQIKLVPTNQKRLLYVPLHDRIGVVAQLAQFLEGEHSLSLLSTLHPYPEQENSSALTLSNRFANPDRFLFHELVVNVVLPSKWPTSSAAFRRQFRILEGKIVAVWAAKLTYTGKHCRQVYLKSYIDP
jgi:hypothetical protein